MAQLNHPSPRLEGRIFLNQFLLLSSWPDVRNETVRCYCFLFPDVRRVKTQILFNVFIIRVDHPSFQQSVKRRTVMPIGSADD